MKKCESCKGTGVWLITRLIKEPCSDCMGSGFEIPEEDILIKEQEEEQEAWKREMYG